MKTILSVIAVILLLGATLSCTQYHAQGAGAGGAIGGVSGAILDDENPWRGGVIGAALGAILGATLTDISMQGAQQAVNAGRPVQYRTNDGRGVYRAEPVDYNAETKCHKVHERAWEDGRLVKDTVREVCEGQKREDRY